MRAKKLEWQAKQFSGSSEIGSFPYAVVFVSIRIGERNVNNITGYYANVTKCTQW